jgi:hypothetical protein
VGRRHDPEDDITRGVLRAHAIVSLPTAYATAVREAIAETGLPAETFPVTCPYTLDEVLANPVALD